jgi:excisionase family DNA binding protein
VTGLLTIKQACALMGVSRRTIYNWMAHGFLEVRRSVGGRPYIVESSLWQVPSELVPKPVTSVRPVVAPDEQAIRTEMEARVTRWVQKKVAARIVQRESESGGKKK